MLHLKLTDVLSDPIQADAQAIAQDLAQNKTQKVFYLVPDHMKFDAELKLLQALKKEAVNLAQIEGREGQGASKDSRGSGLYAQLAVEVYSFSRLAWLFLKDSGRLAQPQLSKTGLAMLIRHILSQHQEEIVYYRREIKQEGFIDQLVSLFMELRRGNVSSKDMVPFFDQFPPKTAYEKNRQAKLEELLKLYDWFNQGLIGHYVELEDLYSLLVHQLQGEDLSQVTFYLQGFERFTAKELQLVYTLMTQAQDLHINLPLAAHQWAALQEKEGKNLDRLEDFDPLAYVPASSYHKLKTFAKAQGIPLKETLLMPEQAPTAHQAGMKAIIAYWQQLFSPGAPAADLTTYADNLAITSTSTPQEEVEAVARLISQLVASGNYRYDDFYVLMRQVEDYESFLVPLFAQSQIPLFLDNASSMLSHPLIEFLSALHDIQAYKYQYEDLMRLLKTQLLPQFSLDQVDALENAILAYGLSGPWWSDDSSWAYDQVAWDLGLGDDLEKRQAWESVQASRQRLQDCLLPLFDTLEKTSSIAEAAAEIYRFLLDQGVTTSLLETRNHYLEQGQLDLARQEEQAWSTFLALLDELVLVLGDQPYEADEFFAILLKGFEEAEFSLVPASLDHVHVSSIDGKRVEGKKIVFVLGASADLFPKTYDNDSLLSQDEREKLSAVLPEEAYLNLDVNYRSRIEPFVALQVLASAQEKIYFFYPQSQLGQSNYLNLLEEAFEPAHLDLETVYGTGRSFVRKSLSKIREKISQTKELDDLEYISMAIMAENPQLEAWFNQVFPSLSHQNVPEKLFLADQLYAGDLHLSITRLENFFKDPFSYFLQYGLRLKERAVLTMTTAEIGNVFHGVLDRLYRTFRQDQLAIHQYSIEALDALVRQKSEEVFLQPQNRLFERSQSLLLSKDLILETLLFTASQMRLQNALSPMNTLATEKRFGTFKEPASLRVKPLPLSNGRLVHLRGIIDRIDQSGNYFSVVDYKSSHRQFDWKKFHDGHSLQLVTYLYVALQNLDKLAAFHSHSVANGPMNPAKGSSLSPTEGARKIDSGLSQSLEDQSLVNQSSANQSATSQTSANPSLAHPSSQASLLQLEPLGAFYREITYEFEDYDKASKQEDGHAFVRLEGLMANDAPAFKSVDEDANLFKIRYKKDGDFYGTPKNLVLGDELQVLFDYLLLKIQEAGDRIFQGDIQLNPVKGDPFVPSLTAYKSIALFDPSLPENRYQKPYAGEDAKKDIQRKVVQRDSGLLLFDKGVAHES